MLSDYEISSGQSFPGHIIRMMGKGAREDDPEGLIPEPFKKIGETAWEVHDYIHTEARFDKIDNALGQIQNQITAMQNSINYLGSKIGITASATQSLILFTNMTNLVTPVQTLMDSTSNAGGGGLQYYARVTNQYMKGLKNSHGDSLESFADFKADTAALRNWCNNLYNLNNPNLAAIELTMYENIGMGGANGFAPLTNLICQSAKSKNAFSKDSIMNCYLILESAFLKLVNTQYQCGILMTNAHNFFQPQDTSKLLDWYTDYLFPHINQEITWFNEAVNYMVVNLNEYRYNDRFQNDMQYMQTQLTPDDLLFNVLARSQFISNMLKDAMGYNYPVIAGTIITPNNFTDGNSPIVNSIGLSFTPMSSGGTADVFNSTAKKIPSQIPYTYWVDGDPAGIGPDNNWNLYRIVHDTVTSNSATPAYSIQIVDNGSNMSPWLHYSPMKGTVTPLYYNPRDPRKTSATKNTADSCVVQFGYFCSGWPWGHLYLSNYQMSHWHHFNYNAIEYNSFNPNGGATAAETPFTGTSNGTPNLTIHGGTFTYPSSSLGTMAMGGNTVSTDNYFIAVDAFFANVNTGTAKPDNNGQLQAWAWNRNGYNMQGSGGNDLWVTIGTGLDLKEKPPYASYQCNSAIINQHYHDQTGNWNTTFGNSGNINFNQQYQPCMQYYYQTHNIGTVPAFVQMTTALQLLYGGYYNYPPMQ